jgi:hypothetical protein
LSFKRIDSEIFANGNSSAIIYFIMAKPTNIKNMTRKQLIEWWGKNAPECPKKIPHIKKDIKTGYFIWPYDDELSKDWIKNG